MNGRRGPSYIDLPGDVLYGQVNEDDVTWPAPAQAHHRIPGDPGMVQEAVNALAKAERPLIVSGTGVIWSQASDEMEQFVNETGDPLLYHPSRTWRRTGR